VLQRGRSAHTRRPPTRPMRTNHPESHSRQRAVTEQSRNCHSRPDLVSRSGAHRQSGVAPRNPISGHRNVDLPLARALELAEEDRLEVTQGELAVFEQERDGGAEGSYLFSSRRSPCQGGARSDAPGEFLPLVNRPAVGRPVGGCPRLGRRLRRVRTGTRTSGNRAEAPRGWRGSLRLSAATSRARADGRRGRRPRPAESPPRLGPGPRDRGGTGLRPPEPTARVSRAPSPSQVCRP
jgi:hypothetical protein